MNTREHFRPVQLRRIVMVWTHHVERFTESMYGFEMPEGRLLWLLAQHGPSTATQLCGLAYMRKFQVSRALARMRDLGFVAMSQNPEDQRSEIVQLTPQGVSASETLLACSVKWADLLEQDLTATERRVLETALQRMLANAEQLGPVVAADLAAERKRSTKPAGGTRGGKKAQELSAATKPAKRQPTTPRRLHLR